LLAAAPESSSNELCRTRSDLPNYVNPLTKPRGQPSHATPEPERSDPSAPPTRRANRSRNNLPAGRNPCGLSFEVASR
jgi:hypothetical protein